MDKNLFLLSGLLIGIAFGYIFHRGGITRYSRVVGMLLLKDFKVMKAIMLAIGVATAGFYIGDFIGLFDLNPKPYYAGTWIGGLIFGVGMGLLGFCPGTMAMRLGAGKYTVLFGMAGMIAGTVIYAEILPVLAPVLQNQQKLTLPQVLHLPPLATGLFMAVMFVLLAKLLDRWDPGTKIPAFEAFNEWSWKTVGILVGALNIIAFIVSAGIRNYPLGSSTGYAVLASWIELLVSPGHLASTPFLKPLPYATGAVWEVFLLVGAALGAHISARRAGVFRLEGIPETWRSAFGDNLALRGTIVFIGGILLALGARMAGGCTSGNILSGWSQLSIGSFAAGLGIFASAIATSLVIYRGKDIYSVQDKTPSVSINS